MAKKFVGFYIDPAVYQEFQLRYPHLFSVFSLRCLHRAIQSKTFFDDVFFNTDVQKTSSKVEGRY